MEITYICFECNWEIEDKAYWIGGEYSGYICEECFKNKY